MQTETNISYQYLSLASANRWLQTTKLPLYYYLLYFLVCGVVFPVNSFCKTFCYNLSIVYLISNAVVIKLPWTFSANRSALFVRASQRDERGFEITFSWSFDVFSYSWEAIKKLSRCIWIQLRWFHNNVWYWI